MKHLILCAALMPLLNFAQVADPTMDNDPRLVGTWIGSEKNQQIKGMKKVWETERRPDGTYTIHFRFTQNGMEQTSDETGTWSTRGNVYSEYHDYDGKTDEYTYEVKDENHVKFTSQSMSMPINGGSYSFTDTRKKPDGKSDKRDGSSPEKAIKVNSVQEEYEYIRKSCPNCQVVSQALMDVKGRAMDLIKVSDDNGKERNYYFDIKSFFGKGF